MCMCISIIYIYTVYMIICVKCIYIYINIHMYMYVYIIYCKIFPNMDPASHINWCQRIRHQLQSRRLFCSEWGQQIWLIIARSVYNQWSLNHWLMINRWLMISDSWLISLNIPKSVNDNVPDQNGNKQSWTSYYIMDKLPPAVSFPHEKRDFTIYFTH